MSRDLVKVLRALPTPERRIRVAVAVRGLSFQALCLRIEMDRSQLSRGMRGIDPLSEARKDAIAAALEVPKHVLWATTSRTTRAA